MKSTPEALRAHAWRVHTLAPDFELLDVWRFEVRFDASHGFDEFLAVYWGAVRSLEGSLLGRIRTLIGQAAGWDDAATSRPIPGCSEPAVAQRLDDTDRERSRFRPDEPSPLPGAGVKPVYRFENEVLYEISNATVHALMHVSCAPSESPMLGVYIKSRGTLTRLYMAAIWPARHAVIYPALMSKVETSWRTKLREREDLPLDSST